MSFSHGSEDCQWSLIVAFPDHNHLHDGTSVCHNKLKCHVYDLDPHAKVMVTGKDQTCCRTIACTSSFQIFISLGAGVQHNQWICRENKSNTCMYVQKKGHRLMSNEKMVGKMRFHSVILLIGHKCPT